ncbi:MAG: four helix bundle protein [Chitinophagales bacterium]
MHQYKELKVWQKSIAIADTIYEITKQFPNEEKFGLVAQMRRACVSMASNIAEGAGKTSSKEFIRFLEISDASSYELDTQSIISLQQKFITEEAFNKISNELSEFQKMLFAPIKSNSKY